MKHEPEPPRLDDDASTSDALRNALRGARGAGPTADGRTRIAQGLAPLLGPGSPPGVPSSASGAGAGAGTGSWVGITILSVIGALAIGVALWSFASHPASPPSPSTPPAPPVPAATPEPPEVPHASPAPTPPPPSPPEAIDNPPAETRAARTTTPAPDERPTEIALLDRARSDLAGRPARSLQSLAEHRRLYPAGILAQEREVLAVDALLRLGRTDDGRARAERFLAAHPGTAHASHVRALLRAAGVSLGQ